MIKRAEVKIKGIYALLMHRYPLEPIEALEKKSKEDQAEVAAYRAENGMLYIPGQAIQRSLIAAATYSKGKGRGSLQKNAAACLLINEEIITLGIKNYLIDSRRVVIHATKGAIVRHRPRIDDWQVTFQIEWDDSLLKESEVNRIISDAGQRVGLLDFRPEKKGPFGRFIITQFKTK